MSTSFFKHIIKITNSNKHFTTISFIVATLSIIIFCRHLMISLLQQRNIKPALFCYIRTCKFVENKIKSIV